MGDSGKKRLFLLSWKIGRRTNTFNNLDKYIWLFRQIRSAFGQKRMAILTEVIFNLDKYVAKWKHIDTTGFSNEKEEGRQNLDKYVKQFGQLHLAIWTNRQNRYIWMQRGWRKLGRKGLPSQLEKRKEEVTLTFLCSWSQQWTSGTKQGLKLIPCSCHRPFYPHHTKHKEVVAYSTNNGRGPTQRKYNETHLEF